MTSSRIPGFYKLSVVQRERLLSEQLGLDADALLPLAEGGISLEVAKGEVVALLGANGAGKTTLLRTISGLLRQKVGVVTFDGEDFGRNSAERRVRRGLAHVPEGRRIFPGLTVKENLDVATTVWKRRGMSAEGDLANVFALFPRLLERQTQLGWSLSGGEQQMLAIGRALMSRP